MCRCLVTGGAGFIGSHLVEALLRRGDAVLVLDDLSTGKAANLPPEARLIRGDVADSGLVTELLAEVDLCFHLAAVASVVRSHEAPLRCHRINQGSFVGILEALARTRRGTPVVYASSAAVYGARSGVAGEDAPCLPGNPYGVDKLACELHARVAGRAWGVPSFGLRFFNIYGPRQDPSSPYSGVVARFSAAAERHGPMTVFGQGNQVRDFVHVSDAVRALLLAGEHASARAPVANICTGRGTTVLELARTVRALAAGVPEIIFAPARPADVPTSIGDPWRARNLLGWTAQVALRDGLRQTLSAFCPAESAPEEQSLRMPCPEAGPVQATLDQVPA